MPKFWLKALGMGMGKPGEPLEPGEPLRDDWTELDNGLLKRRVMFPRRPSVERGDRIVYYSAGRGRGLIFAEGEVTSYPYEERSDRRPRYPWWVDVRLDLGCDFIHDGVPLETLSVDGRDLRRLMRRRSHIRLTPREYEAAIRALQTVTASAGA